MYQFITITLLSYW